MRPLAFMMLVAAMMLVSACGTQVPDDASGAEVFELVCARCHGSQLGGGVGPALDAGSEAADKTDAYYQQTISRGRGRMPSFGSSLTQEQIDLVIDFLREQQRP